ncbi:MAG: ABC transporter permease [Candidatus Riflemargulisbacteria bacterium]
MKMLLAVLKKEFIHIIKDPSTLFIILIWPVLMLIFFGYAITLEMRSVNLLVNDMSHSRYSRDLISHIAAGDFFNIQTVSVSESDINKLFRQGKTSAVMIIPVDLEESLQTKSQTNVSLILDASDPNAAANITNYLGMIVNSFNRENSKISQPFKLNIRYMYNPSLKSSFFFVPGLTAIIMLLLSALLTSISIVKEKEQNTMDQIMVSPTPSYALILGKVIPYAFVAFLGGLLVIFVAIFWFQVPMRGSLFFIQIMMLLYIFTGCSFGMLISTFAKTQQLATMATLMITVLPTTLLSGFMFPLESMPVLFRWISQLVPATHYIQIIRGAMLKGNNFLQLADHVLALLVITVVLLFISIIRLKKEFEN